MLTDVLRFDHVSFSYARKPVLEDISFHLKQGSIHGLLGPNGTGKSTTMQLASGLLCPDKGSVSVFGLDPFLERQKISSWIGYLPEVPGLYRQMKTRELVTFLQNLYSIDDKQTVGLLEQCGLEPLMDRIVGQLSKGNLQKVAMFQALCHGPKLIILDEPTSGLDPASVVDVRNLILALAKKQVTVLISTHILSEAQALCDSLTIMDKGRVVASGRLDEMTGKTCVRILVKFNSTQYNQAMKCISMHSVNIIEHDTGKALVTVADADRIAPLAKALAMDNIDVFELRRLDDDVENLFLQLTRSKNEDRVAIH